MVDLNNAHSVPRSTSARKKTKQISREAADAQRLLNDPAYIDAQAQVEKGLMNLLCEIKHDGSRECEDAEREICRTLRTLRSVDKVLRRTINGEVLRLADFKPTPVEDT